MNRSFLKFFGVNNVDEFKSKYKCLSHYFISADGYLNLDLSKVDDALIQKIKDTKKTKRVVQIANHNGNIHTLTIKIDKLEDDENLHVIVLSDITTLQKRSEKLEKRANIDSLTGAYSRAKFNNLFHSEFARSTRYFNPLTILFIDIDNFKIVNDTYGHDIGDDVLKKFANLISINSREFDVLARWGGEEFILMLPQTNINDGYKLAEKIRNIIASNEFDKIGTLTCSIGLSMLNKGDSHESLIKRADNALYKAKSSGRNRTIIEI
jgi:diguanylate cyclase (GGDEF)-like protein